MTEPTIPVTPPPVPPTPADLTPADPVQDIASLPEWAQKLIRETRKEAGDNRAAAKKIQDEAALAERKRLEEAGQWQTLAQQRASEIDALKVQAERAAAYEKVMAESNNRRIAAIPERFRGAVPTNYDPAMLAAWLDSSAHLFMPPKAPGLNGGQQGEQISADKVELTPLQIKIAEKLKVPKEAYAKRVAELQNMTEKGWMPPGSE